MAAPRDLLDVLEALDRAARDVLCELGAVTARPCAPLDGEPERRRERGLLEDGRLVVEADGAGAALLDGVWHELAERLADQAGVELATGPSPDDGRAHLAGRLDYRLRGADSDEGRAAIELWLASPLGGAER